MKFFPCFFFSHFEYPTPSTTVFFFPLYYIFTQMTSCLATCTLPSGISTAVWVRQSVPRFSFCGCVRKTTRLSKGFHKDLKMAATDIMLEAILS